MAAAKAAEALPLRLKLMVGRDQLQGKVQVTKQGALNLDEISNSEVDLVRTDTSDRLGKGIQPTIVGTSPTTTSAGSPSHTHLMISMIFVNASIHYPLPRRKR
jgi:hypothetical protein